MVRVINARFCRSERKYNSFCSSVLSFENYTMYQLRCLFHSAFKDTYSFHGLICFFEESFTRHMRFFKDLGYPVQTVYCCFACGIAWWNILAALNNVNLFLKNFHDFNFHADFIKGGQFVGTTKIIPYDLNGLFAFKGIILLMLPLKQEMLTLFK
jgi:hypothetical protein